MKKIVLLFLGLSLSSQIYADNCHDTVKAISIEQLGVNAPRVTLSDIKRKLGEPKRVYTIKQELVAWESYAVVIKDDVIAQELGPKRPSQLKDQLLWNINLEELKKLLGEPVSVKKDLLKSYSWYCAENRAILNTVFNSAERLLELDSNFCQPGKKQNMRFCVGGLFWRNNPDMNELTEKLVLE